MSAKYQRIAREIALSLGSAKLPTEAQLCSRYVCSRQTVRSALALLEQQGLIIRRQGSGSYPVKSAAVPSRQIVLILADREEYTAPAAVRELRRAAQEAGFELRCMETQGDREREAECLRTLLRQRPAGIILEPITDVLGCFHPELLAALKEAGIPMVLLGSGAQTPPAFFPDETAGAALLVSHLSEAGHRQLAAILKWDDSRGIRRFRGLSAASAEAGLSLEPAHCLWYGEAERQRLLEGDEALLRRFREENLGDCTAVVCFNDEIALRLQRYLQAKGEMRSIVSYDNSYLAQSASLTSLNCPGFFTAALAALLGQITGAAPASPPPVWKLHARRSG